MIISILLLKNKVITIDFGSYYTKAAHEGSNNVPDMLLNTFSKRLTPSFVAFNTPKDFDNITSDPLSPEEIESLVPIIGDHAYTKLLSYPWLGGGYFQPYIDLDKNETRDLADRLLSYPPCETRFKNFNLTATFLHFYTKMMLKDEFENTRVNFVVPGSFTEPQILELHDIARAAKLQNETITWDWEAAANLFAQRRPDVIQPDNRIGLFVDIGATSSKAYAIRFEEQKGVPKYNARLLDYHIDYDTGGAYLTAGLARFVKKKLTSKEISPAEMGRILEQCEKAKRTLSLLEETKITIENISGKDRIVTITRDDLDEVAKPHVLRISKLIKLSYRKSKVDFVEIIGGGSRSPPIRRAIMKEIGAEKLNSSMNVDEALAMGGQYQVLTNWVAGQMNESFYKIDICALYNCHDVLLGTSKELGFSNNPEFVYFNITTPLRRGLFSYNWTYYVPKPGYGLTNYFYYTRGPVRLDRVLSCYLGDCKPNSATLLRPYYGNFVNYLEAVTNDRRKLEYLTNELEEMYNVVKSSTNDTKLYLESKGIMLDTILERIDQYLFGNDFNISSTTQLLEEMINIQKYLVIRSEALGSKEKLQDSIDRAFTILNVTYPMNPKWLEPNVLRAFMEKTESVVQFMNSIDSIDINKEQIDEVTASLDTWCDALPPVPKKISHEIIIQYLNKFLDKILNLFVDL